MAAAQASESSYSSSSSSSSSNYYDVPRREGESVEAFVERTCSFCESARRGILLRTSNDREEHRGEEQHEGQGQAQAKERQRQQDNKQQQRQDQRHAACIWLHAFRYERRDPTTPERDWAFQTPPPEWAVDGFVEEEGFQRSEKERPATHSTAS